MGVEAVADAYDTLNRQVDTRPHPIMQLFRWKVLGEHPADVDVVPAIEENGVRIADVNGLYPGREWDPFDYRQMSEDEFRELWQDELVAQGIDLDEEVDGMMEEYDIDVHGDDMDSLLKMTGVDPTAYDDYSNEELFAELMQQQLYYMSSDHLFADRVYSPPTYIRTIVEDLKLTDSDVENVLDALRKYQEDEPVDVYLWQYEEDETKQPLTDDIDAATLLSFDREGEIETTALRHLSRKTEAGRPSGETIAANIFLQYTQPSLPRRGLERVTSALERIGVETSRLDALHRNTLSVWMKFVENDEDTGVYPFITFYGDDLHAGQERALEIVERVEEAGV